MMKNQASKIAGAVVSAVALSAGALVMATGVFAEDNGKAETTKDGTRLDTFVLPVTVDGSPLKLQVLASSVPNEYCVDVVEADGGGGGCAADWDLAKRDKPAAVISNYPTGARLERGEATPGVLLTIADPERPIGYTNQLTKEPVEFKAQGSNVALTIKGHDLVAYVQPFDPTQKPDEDGSFPFIPEYR